MESMETAKVRAQGKVKLAAVVLFLLILAGGVREYQKAVAPSDEAVVIYVSAKTETVTNEAAVESAQPETATAEQALAAPEIQEPETTVAEENGAVVSSQNDGVAAFVFYMNEINRDLEEVTKPESALDKIILPAKVDLPEKREELFEDGKIEVFDSEEGVIRVEETAVEVPVDTKDKAVVTDAHNEVAAVETETENTVSTEEATQASVSAPVAEGENEVTQAAENDDEAINLMKDIAERAETEENNL